MQKLEFSYITSIYVKWCILCEKQYGKINSILSATNNYYVKIGIIYAVIVLIIACGGHMSAVRAACVIIYDIAQEDTVPYGDRRRLCMPCCSRT